MKKIIKLLNDMFARKEFGKVTIHVESGRITLIKKEITIKP